MITEILLELLKYYLYLLAAVAVVLIIWWLIVWAICGLLKKIPASSLKFYKKK